MLKLQGCCRSIYPFYTPLHMSFSAGITIGALPTLVQKNVAAITVGVNDGTSPPDVPKIFNWKFDDKNSVIAMWIKGTCMAVKGKT